MANIPADIDSAQAAGRIPSGISLDYLAQSRDQSAKIAILFVGCLTIVIVVARCYARIFLVKSFGLDDALAAFTLVGLQCHLPITGRGNKDSDTFPLLLPTALLYRDSRTLYSVDRPG